MLKERYRDIFPFSTFYNFCIVMRIFMLKIVFQNDITPLLLACHYDHPNVAQYLIEKGASPYLASQNGQTPLHIAARKNQVY